jgi:multidrug resistance efflux pump
VLTTGLEVARRIAELPTLDDVYLFLVNDLRVLAEFDRCFLVMHVGGRSRFVAAGNQPVLEKQSKLHDKIEGLARLLLGQKKALLLTAPVNDDDPNLQQVSPLLRDGLKDYLSFSGYQFILVTPLLYHDSPIGHLIMEFGAKSPPSQVQVVALLHASPIIASMMVEKWLIDKRPRMAAMIAPGAEGRGIARRILGSPLSWALIVFFALAMVLFLAPVDYTVGGQAEIAPWDRRVAFAAVEGLIDKVSIHEGDSVVKDQVLAVIDSTEIDYKIESARREGELLTKQAALLSIESDSAPAKLAEARIIQLKSAKAANDLKFLEWQRRFLEIRAPVQGIVVNKDIESLAGKKLRAGEPFCEIAVPGDLSADVLVPEDRIALVRQGQPLNLYLNKDPFTGHKLHVSEISPVAEVSPRYGNLCRVRARLAEPIEGVKVGMKGVGKISTGQTNLWRAITQRLVAQWNIFALRF